MSNNSCLPIKSRIFISRRACKFSSKTCKFSSRTCKLYFPPQLLCEIQHGPIQYSFLTDSCLALIGQNALTFTSFLHQERKPGILTITAPTWVCKEIKITALSNACHNIPICANIPKKSDCSFSEFFSRAAVDDEVDWRIENEKQVIQILKNVNCNRNVVSETKTSNENIAGNGSVLKLQQERGVWNKNKQW